MDLCSSSIKKESAMNETKPLKHYSIKECQELLREQELSGLSPKSFCKMRGVNLSTFYSFRRRLKNSLNEELFIEVKQSEPVEQLSLVVSGYEVKFPVSALKAVLAALREA
jgi:hypothetical protein